MTPCVLITPSRLRSLWLSPMVLVVGALGLQAQGAPARREATLAISPFALLGANTTGSLVASRMPDLLRIALLRFRWIDAQAFDDVLPGPQGAVRTRVAQEALRQSNAEELRNSGMQFWLTGEIYPFGDEMLFTARLTSLEADRTLYEASELAARGEVLSTVTRIAEEVAGRLEEELAAPRASGQKVIVVTGFQSQDPDSTLRVLETILSQNLRGPLESALARTDLNVVIQSGITVGPELPAEVDGVIGGDYRVRADTILVTATLRERESGVESAVTVRGRVDDAFSIPRNLAGRVAELIVGRLAPTGEWRAADVLEGTAETLHQRAQELARTGDLTGAVLLFRRAIQQQPGFASAHIGLASVYAERGEYDAALEELYEVKRAAPNDPQLYLAAGLIHIDRGAYSQALSELNNALDNAGDNREVAFQARLNLGSVHVRLRDYEEAIRHYSEARDIDDGRPETYGFLARVYRAVGDLERATRILEDGRERFPADSSFLDELGDIYNELGDQHFEDDELENARDRYSNTFRLDPLDRTVSAYAYRGLGAVYHRAGVYGMSLESYQQAQVFEPTTHGYALLGDLHRHVGQYDSALVNLRVAASRDPSNEWPRRLLGLTFKDLGDESARRGSHDSAATMYESAIRELSNAIEIRPTVWSYSTLGEAYRATRRYDEAIDSFERAIALDSDYVAAHRELGLTYRDREDYKYAIATLRTVVELNPSKLAFAQVAETYLLSGQPAAAAAWADSALRLDEDYTDAHLIQGNARYEMGEYERAMEAALRVIHLSPSNTDVYRLLSQAFEQLEQYEEAASTLEQLIAQDNTNVLARQYLAYMYHEFLFRFELAYGQHLAIAQLGYDDPSSRANLAESQLTTRRYREAFQQAEKLLRESRRRTPTLGLDVRLTMQLLMIAAAVLQNDREWAAVASWGFLRDYRDMLADYTTSWRYSGIRHFTETEHMPDDSRSLIIRLIDLLDPEKPEARVEDVETFLLSWTSVR